MSHIIGLISVIDSGLNFKNKHHRNQNTTRN